jgi:tRNA (guanine-N7-)-methyltransferase
MQQRIQTFKPRRGRYSTQMREGLERGTHLVTLPTLPPLPTLFDGLPVILEIGFGMGDATLAQSLAHPDHGILAIDVHTPGVGRLLAELEVRGIDNVRVIEGDALTLLHELLPARSLAGIRVFFPDPWPKARHHKRRIMNAANLDVMATALVPGGFLHFATDWHDYAEAVREALTAHPHFRLLEPAEQTAIASAASRPRTKFEARGIAAGRHITDLVAVRV